MSIFLSISGALKSILARFLIFYKGRKTRSIFLSINGAAKSTDELTQAFAQDGYDVVQNLNFQGKRGLEAQSRTAQNYETREKKTVYYVEGSHYQMGYLLGQMAAAKVETMTTKFLDSIIPSFFHSNVTQPKHEWLWKLAIDLIEDLDKNMRAVVPQPLLDEMHGLADGCRAVNSKTTVSFDKIFTLNVGVDFLLSIVYNVEGLWKKIPGLQPQQVKAPKYYKNNIPSTDGKTVQINGATSLCNLSERTITSHYGYFADEWIALTLPNYISGVMNPA